MGVAVGELELKLAHPLETVHAASDSERFAVDRASGGGMAAGGCWSWGCPCTSTAASTSCRGAAGILPGGCAHASAIDTYLTDERLTSHAAGLALADAGVRGRRQKDMLDQVAAQQILETYFAGSHEAA